MHTLKVLNIHTCCNALLILPYIHTYTHTWTYMQITYIHTLEVLRKQTYIHICCMYSPIYSYIHTYILYTYTQIWTYIHTYIHLSNYLLHKHDFIQNLLFGKTKSENSNRVILSGLVWFLFISRNICCHFRWLRNKSSEFKKRNSSLLLTRVKLIRYIHTFIYTEFIYT